MRNSVPLAACLFILTFAAIPVVESRIACAQSVRLVEDQNNDASENAESGESRIRSALAKRIEIDLLETKLSEFAHELEEALHIEVELDFNAMEEIGLDREATVSRNIKYAPLQSALQLILGDLGLVHSVQGDVLLFTTVERYETVLTTKVYDVSELMRPTPDHDLVYVHPDNADLESFFDLIQAIEWTVKPDSWDVKGGPGSIHELMVQGRRMLLVLQHERAHQQIADLLDELRTASKQGQRHGRQAEANGADKVFTKIYPVFGVTNEDVKEVAELLQEAVAPESWTEDKRVICKANAILVRHQGPVHEQVRLVLDGLGVLHASPAQPEGGGSGQTSVPPGVGAVGIELADPAGDSSKN